MTDSSPPAGQSPEVQQALTSVQQALLLRKTSLAAYYENPEGTLAPHLHDGIVAATQKILDNTVGVALTDAAAQDAPIDPGDLRQLSALRGLIEMDAFDEGSAQRASAEADMAALETKTDEERDRRITEAVTPMAQAITGLLDYGTGEELVQVSDDSHAYVHPRGIHAIAFYYRSLKAARDQEAPEDKAPASTSEAPEPTETGSEPGGEGVPGREQKLEGLQVTLGSGEVTINGESRSLGADGRWGASALQRLSRANLVEALPSLAAGRGMGMSPREIARRILPEHLVATERGSQVTSAAIDWLRRLRGSDGSPLVIHN